MYTSEDILLKVLNTLNDLIEDIEEIQIKNYKNFIQGNNYDQSVLKFVFEYR